ncbi:MAG: 30S ribosomal protein S9 [Thermoguttaceae bacterium]|nr:30S ribosomal protein S9 [Thermoguttaceae bacterium]
MADKVIIEGKGNNDSLGTGRRKTAIARVRIRPGKGLIAINGRSLENYFCNVQQRNAVLAPLTETGKKDEVDVIIRVSGGGITGQSGACKLGIARALRMYDAGLYEVLKDANLLTRDSRMVERKKPGLRKARRATQFSKR